ncbi:MAG: hypothetical protein IJ506_06630, partial [Clostridia bacterium]|nr:hypothetical protein [Clostridia bacterium]
MKKRLSILVLLTFMLACLTFGFVGCNDSKSDDEGRKNPSIVVETDEMEFALELYSAYTMPYAGVYYENLDRVDDVEVRMSLIDPTGGYLYENTLNNEKIDFFMPGEYKLVYSAKNCKDVTITIYVCEKLEGATNFAVEGNTLTWDPIDGATGYAVSVNGGEATITENESFTSEIFAKQGFYVGVVAKGDNKKWLDSDMESYEVRIPLQEGEVASFDNPCYELDIVKATPDTLNAEPSQMEYLTEAECEGSTGGALKFLIRSGEYGTGLFRLNLENKIDGSADFDGMEVRFKLDSKDYIWSDEETATRLLLGVPYNDERRVGRGMYLHADYNDSWQIVKIPQNAVTDFDGLSFLQFSLFNMTRSTGQGYLYLDYIRLYKDELAAPQNVAINGEKLDWDDVENTYEYVISVDKTDNANSELERNYYYATQSEIALSALGIDPAITTQQYEIKVRAISAVSAKGSSEWSEKIVKREAVQKNELSSFNNAIYTLDVVDSVVNDGKTSFDHMWYRKYEPVAGAEGGNALRIALSAQGPYGTFSSFSVNLPEPLDLDNGYDCIVLRFKVEFSNYQSNDTLGIQLVGSQNDSQNYKTFFYRKLVKVGEWMNFQLTMDELKEYYETGDTKLSFALTNPVENKGGSSVYLNVALDWLRYYNSIAAPENVRIEDGMLKWNEVEGAKSYTVNVNGVDVYEGTETSYALTSLTGAFTFKVRTESSVESLAASAYSTEAYYEVLTADQLATFDHAGYAHKVEAGNPNITDSQIASAWRSGKPVVFDAKIGENGAININPQPSQIGGMKLFIFSVQLGNALDLTSDTYNAVQVRFLVEWISANEKNKTYFTLLHATDKTHAGYTTPITSASKVSAEIVQDETKTNFQTLIVTFEDMTELGYKEGDESLTFGIWVPTAALSAQSACTWLDDIVYCTYNALDIPQNVRVENGMLKWDEVEGASGYTVSVNGEEIAEIVKGTSYDVSSLTGVFALKVLAVSDKEGVDPSAYSKEIYCEVLADGQIATFNHAGYTESFVAGNPNITDSQIATAWRSGKPVVFDANVGEGGAVNINPQASQIGGMKLFIFS